jgi:hypothetical protein
LQYDYDGFPEGDRRRRHDTGSIMSKDTGPTARHIPDRLHRRTRPPARHGHLGRLRRGVVIPAPLGRDAARVVPLVSAASSRTRW